MISKKEIAMEEAAARRAAEALFNEHKTGAKFKTLDPSTGLASIADAYDIQDRYVALMKPEQGEAAGYKVGLTSKTMQTFCGIDHPIGGVVLARRVHSSGATIRRGDYGRLGLEFEVAVRIKSDIPPGAQTSAAVAPHIDGVCAGIEVVDDRAADYG
jgi:2-keto-4-pentenoate hydratase